MEPYINLNHFAVIVLLGAYYVSNVMYQVNLRNFFSFWKQFCLRKKKQRGKVTIAKFLHQLSQEIVHFFV